MFSFVVCVLGHGLVVECPAAGDLSAVEIGPDPSDVSFAASDDLRGLPAVDDHGCCL